MIEWLMFFSLLTGLAMGLTGGRSASRDTDSAYAEARFKKACEREDKKFDDET